MMTFLLYALFTMVGISMLISIHNIMNDKEERKEFFTIVKDRVLYHLIGTPINCVEYVSNLRFLKYENLYVSREEVAKGFKDKSLYYETKDKDGRYKSHKMLIKSIGLYKRLDFISPLEDHEYVKCIKMEETTKSLKSMNKFNI